MGSYIWPTPSTSIITSPFGYRTDPIKGGRAFHSGVDIGVSYGSVLATKPGKVTRAAWYGGYGNCIDISHGDGITSRYAHLSKMNVKKGDKVSAGQNIATSGSTGYSTGPHLHFEISINGAAKDPLNYVKSSDTKAKYTGSAGESTSSGSGKSSSKEITKVAVKATVGKKGKKSTTLRTAGEYLSGGMELLLQNDSNIYNPSVEDEIVIEWNRKNTPGKMTFCVIKDDVLKLDYGDAVRFRYDGKNIFLGYIFTMEQKDDRRVEITCYDQLRYFKNKDIFSFKKMTYSNALKAICKRYGLKQGTIANTKRLIPARIEDGTIFDTLGNYADLTMASTQKMFVLYDEFGKIRLTNINNMKLDLYLDAETMQGYDYQGSIDDNVYTCIKLYRDNEETGTREVYVRNSTAKQKKWGILTYVDETDYTKKADIKTMAKALASLYGSVQRKLTLKECFGDIRVRGGSAVVVNLTLFDKKISNYMIVESVKHSFSKDGHTMDLTVIGGDFVA